MSEKTKVFKFIDRAQSVLEELWEEEQENFDNLPEGLQEGEKGERMQENIDALEEFLDNLEETDDLEEMQYARRVGYEKDSAYN